MRQARSALARRYLEGRSSLFPELAGEWETLLRRCEQLVELASDLEACGSVDRERGRLSRRTPAPTLESLRDTTRAEANAEVAVRHDEARLAALDWLGETERAAEVARRLLLAG
jgi:hypothetical protein